MGGCSYLPLAQGNGVHREVESDGPQRQCSDPRNTNTIRHMQHTAHGPILTVQLHNDGLTLSGYVFFSNRYSLVYGVN